MRLALYSDDPYRGRDGAVAADMPFALFLAAVGRCCDGHVLLGRLDGSGAPGRLDGSGAPGNVALPAGEPFVALPWWEDLGDPRGFARALPRTLARYWRVLGDVDAVLLFGPSPVGLLFAALAAARGRRVALGVRMRYADYVRRRHPGSRSLALAARALELAWRALARACPTVVVGSDLAASYAHARRLHEVLVSLVPEALVAAAPHDDPVAGESASGRGYDGPLTVLAVGRIDHEKNPLLLADVLHRLRGTDPRWRLVVCGDGPLAPALAERLRALGDADRAELAGFTPAAELRERYRAAHAVLHVSLTEGVPQVLLEAFAAGTPVVATDVGGVRAAAGDAALLVPPRDAAAAAAALGRVAAEPALRARLVAAGLERARAHTLEAESRRVAAFVSGQKAT
jgi:glycosyltransferase involved in cell wall biosynthesis